MHHIIFRVCLTNDIYRYTGVNKRNTSIRALNCLHISVMLHQRQGNSPRWSISDEFYRRMVKPTKSNVIAIELSPSCRAGGNFRVNGQYWVHQSRTVCDTYSTEHGLHRTAYTGSGGVGHAYSDIEWILITTPDYFLLDMVCWQEHNQTQSTSTDIDTDQLQRSQTERVID